MSICNNDVTYHDKWKTPENQAALDKLESKFFHRTVCSSHLPLGWAPEVLEMLETIHNKLGIKQNEHTIRGYHIQGNMHNWFIINPWKGLFRAFYDETFRTYKFPRKKKTIRQKFGAMLEAFFHPIQYGFRAFKIRRINPLINKFSGNEVHLSQVKEKYGNLTVYFRGPDHYEEWVYKQIRMCEIKLAMKGAYYPIENLWESTSSYSMGTDYEPDTIEATLETHSDGSSSIRVQETRYRGLMKEMGLDIKKIEDQYIMSKVTKEDPQ